jgi:site-specific recombinase XerD
VRFFYTHTLNRKIEIERIPFPRRQQKLPLILSRDEAKALLEAPQKTSGPRRFGGVVRQRSSRVRGDSAQTL